MPLLMYALLPATRYDSKFCLLLDQEYDLFQLWMMNVRLLVRPVFCVDQCPPPALPAADVGRVRLIHSDRKHENDIVLSDGRRDNERGTVTKESGRDQRAAVDMADGCHSRRVNREEYTAQEQIESITPLYQQTISPSFIRASAINPHHTSREFRTGNPCTSAMDLRLYHQPVVGC
jgi:hypothetical protein